MIFLYIYTSDMEGEEVSNLESRGQKRMFLTNWTTTPLHEEIIGGWSLNFSPIGALVPELKIHEF